MDGDPVEVLGYGTSTDHGDGRQDGEQGYVQWGRFDWGVHPCRWPKFFALRSPPDDGPKARDSINLELDLHIDNLEHPAIADAFHFTATHPAPHLSPLSVLFDQSLLPNCCSLRICVFRALRQIARPFSLDLFLSTASNHGSHTRPLPFCDLERLWWCFLHGRMLTYLATTLLPY